MHQPSLAGTKLAPYFHVCAFFDSRDDEYRVLSPFYKEGLNANEKVLHVIDERLQDDHAARLEQNGIDVCTCRDEGRLAFLGWKDTYLKDGRFDSEMMLTAVQAVIRDGIEKGFERSRIMGNMNWALDGPPGAEDLIEYEARVNEVLSRDQQPAVCVYDVARLTGAMMMDILRSHPLTLVNGVVHENPLFVQPEALLEELKERRAARRKVAEV